ncbi:MAG: rhodanese-like domain-containing protein [Flavobacteriales bacterium]|jgi:phage shock protein E|nr:rhodanese-like domain-containing protein [Flavobacteriales bacterium]MBT5089691.1 rhodanese-like domain-containing protein [Flavobacteriales bacterium]
MNIQELINDTATTIVDVRTEIEFEEGNVQGSINIPLHNIIEKVEELKAMQPLVLCCLSGNRSGQATAFLQAQGCDNVYNGGGWEMVDAQKR